MVEREGLDSADAELVKHLRMLAAAFLTWELNAFSITSSVIYRVIPRAYFGRHRLQISTISRLYLVLDLLERMSFYIDIMFSSQYTNSYIVL